MIHFSKYTIESVSESKRVSEHERVSEQLNKHFNFLKKPNSCTSEITESNIKPKVTAEKNHSTEDTFDMQWKLLVSIISAETATKCVV